MTIRDANAQYTTGLHLQRQRMVETADVFSKQEKESWIIARGARSSGILVTAAVTSA
jgi:hypothetical protein